MNRLHFSTLALTLLWIGAGALSVFGQADDDLWADPSFGNVDGREAVLVAPVDAHATDSARLHPGGFTVHLTPVFEPERDLVFPAGMWFAPPRGRYRVWLESDSKISPFSSRLVYASRPFDGHGVRALLSVVEGGRVRPAAETEPGHLFRLLHAGSYVHNGAMQQELSRQVRVAVSKSSLLMPPGPTLAGVWDEAEGKYVALSRPFHVAAGRTIAAPLETPGNKGFLVTQLLRPKTAGSEDHPELEMYLETEHGRVTPHVLLDTAASVYGIWYDLEPGSARLTASSEVAYLEPVTVDLKRGRIERVTAELEEQTLELPKP